MYSRKPGACHRATRYRWTLAEYSRTIFMAQPLELRFLSPGSESKIIADESSQGASAKRPKTKRMLRVSSLGPGRVRIASRFRAGRESGTDGAPANFRQKAPENPWQSRQSGARHKSEAFCPNARQSQESWRTPYCQTEPRRGALWAGERWLTPWQACAPSRS